MDNQSLLEHIKTKHLSEIIDAYEEYQYLNVIIKPEFIRNIISYLRDDPNLKFEMLVDLVSIDYSKYPEKKLGRFGLVYHMKSLTHNHRVAIRVFLPEENPEIDSIHDLYKNANWLEREAWDQMGIRFRNHPNLKRILNHKDFVGHPLRKDYPIDRRQWLSEPDDLMDEMEKRLKEKGIILRRG
ncbi:MAG: NADH-quinone oxidoreductase subunit C [Leptospiraceae bacterium]|nr:NADH-quinone oxidoreductase subunit C [Leptospiraceae bacterium]MDW7975828.1 NADH-quinone oxidoreductase subunit C [Leptospiraceae bacterium]